jgi:hypothetical protein
MSTPGLATGLPCTSSMTARPCAGPRSNRYGGRAVASANSLAAGSSVAASWSRLLSLTA